MNISLIPTVNLNEIIENFGTSDFPFLRMAENDSYVSVSLTPEALTFCEMDIEYYLECGDGMKTKRCLNLRQFILKMNEMGYKDSILVYVNW